MKKIKLQLDKDTILEFLLQNVEKIVLGVVVLIFLSLVYSAIAHSGRFDRYPKQLEDEAANSQRTIDTTPPESALTTLSGKDRDYVAEASRSRDPIRENLYSIGGWSPPLFEKRPLRDMPRLLPVQDLHSAAGMGAFRAAAAAEGATGSGGAPRGGAAVRAAAGGTRGQRWIVLTGLVPLEQQQAAYAEVFKQAVFQDPQKDEPAYLGYFVQRAEVGNSGDAAKPDWEQVPLITSRKAIKDAESQWSSSKDTDVVDPKFLIHHLVFPLGPLEGEHWDASVAHEPEIALEKKEKAGGPADGRGRAGPLDPREGPPGGRERAPAGESNPFGSEESKSEAVAKTVAAPGGNVVEEQKDLGFRLFRYFDFNVEPGKRYIYRVRLALANPNYLMKATVLKKAELAKDPWLPTAWSEPSPIISVPRDTQVLVNAVKPPPRANAEPTATITVLKWLIRSGLKVSHEFPQVTRGQLANFGDISVHEAGGPVNFFSDATVVDVRGGDHLGKKTSTLTTAGEILLMDADGSLSVRNEVDDSAACRQLAEAAKEATPRQPQLTPRAEATPAPKGRGLGAVDRAPPTTPRKRH